MMDYRYGTDFVRDREGNIKTNNKGEEKTFISNKSGGNDGCVNFNDKDNAGLVGCL